MLIQDSNMEEERLWEGSLYQAQAATPASSCSLEVCARLALPVAFVTFSALCRGRAISGASRAYALGP